MIPSKSQQFDPIPKTLYSLFINDLPEVILKYFKGKAGEAREVREA